MYRKSLIKVLILFQIIVIFTTAAKGKLLELNNLNGRNVNIAEYPYQVSLQLARNGMHLCGGGILSDRWILTAAQCTQGAESMPENVDVVVGTSDLANGGLRYKLEQIVNHPRFNWARRLNDISMLKTQQSMQFGRTDCPSFPTDFPSFEIDHIIENGIGLTHVVLAGWGTFRVS